MALRDTAPTSSGNGQGPSPLIRNLPVPAEDTTPSWERLLPAWIVSGVLHIVMLSLFLLVTVSGTGAQGVDTQISIHGDIQDNNADKVNLTNTDLGTDPNNEYNLPIDNIGDMTVASSAEVTAGAKVGVENAPEAAPRNVGPPIGWDLGIGTGTGLPKDDGKGPLGKPGPRGGGLDTFSFHGRNPMTRSKIASLTGGNPKSEQAVALGLAWLARHQHEDGHWSFHEFHAHGKCNCGGGGVNSDVAATGLALLPFLGAGETHRGSSRSTLYSKNVERALRWLISRQSSDGRFGDGYAHAIAALALCEAFGMTNDPTLKAPAQRAINCCVVWQAANGGFRYSPKQEGDLSVSGWHIQALKSGQMAGLHVPNDTLIGINRFLDTVVGTPDASGYGYTDRQPTVRMTAVGLLCRQYLGWGERHPALRQGVEFLRRVPPTAPPCKDLYYYYYATQVLHQMQGEAWEQWNYGVDGRPGMRDLLIASQDEGTEKPHQRGSWDPAPDCFGKQLGRLGTTALSILTLEVYYRHLPLYQRELAAQKDEQIRNK